MHKQKQKQLYTKKYVQFMKSLRCIDIMDGLLRGYL